MKGVILNEHELALMNAVFQKHPEINKILLFGSRAKGTAKINSDIDLAIDGKMSDLQVEALAMELDELPLPYKFDLKLFAGIRNTALSEHIARVGINIYP